MWAWLIVIALSTQAVPNVSGQWVLDIKRGPSTIRGLRVPWHLTIKQDGAILNTEREFNADCEVCAYKLDGSENRNPLPGVSREMREEVSTARVIGDTIVVTMSDLRSLWISKTYAFEGDSLTIEMAVRTRAPSTPPPTQKYYYKRSSP